MNRKSFLKSLVFGLIAAFGGAALLIKNKFNPINKLSNIDNKLTVCSQDLIDGITRSGKSAQDAVAGLTKAIETFNTDGKNYEHICMEVKENTDKNGKIIAESFRKIFETNKMDFDRSSV